ncbi:MAG: phosphomannomutase [Pseudomonadota bacterium]
MAHLTCFKAYDIRGRLGVDLDEEIASRVGRALVQVLDVRTVVLARDCRASSEELANALAEALIQDGVVVLDLGLAGTEEMYFATDHLGADAGVCVTASHNPIDYNGMKLVGKGSVPLDPETDLTKIRLAAERAEFGSGKSGGARKDVAASTRQAYVDRVLSFVDVSALTPLKILVNAGNGAAGPTFDALADALQAAGAPLHFDRMHHTPDASFPNGIPNPLLLENRPVTADAVVAHGADFGVAWDGDFDRCFLFDHTGAFVDGEYIVGLLADVFLRREAGATVIHDPRVIWNTQDIVKNGGGRAVQGRTGHAFVKQAMRRENAVYGGEMSAHHYFRDFTFCDSGMIPWLLIAELISQTGASLRELVEARRQAYPSSGEINFRVQDPPSVIAHLHDLHAPKAVAVDDMDGLSLDMGDWRFNLRASNTEPVLRLNVETRRLDPAPFVAELRRQIEQFAS